MVNNAILWVAGWLHIRDPLGFSPRADVCHHPSVCSELLYIICVVRCVFHPQSQAPYSQWFLALCATIRRVERERHDSDNFLDSLSFHGLLEKRRGVESSKLSEN